MDKKPNVNLDMSKLNKYIDILIKYADLLELDKFVRVGMRYRYNGDYGVSSKDVDGDIYSIKDKLNNLVNLVNKYARDVIDIYPSELHKLNINNINNIDFLLFSTMENDNAIAVNKYLDKVKGEAITEYYSSKPSGSYVGD